MPLYEYQCKPNQHRFEVRHGINEPGPTECPVCGSEVRRVIQPAGIIFKGSGFYATDSRGAKKSAPAPKSTDNSTQSGGETGTTPSTTDKPKTDSAPAAKAE